MCSNTWSLKSQFLIIAFVSGLTSLRIFLATNQFCWRARLKTVCTKQLYEYPFCKNNFILFTLFSLHLSIFWNRFFGPIVLFGNPETDKTIHLYSCYMSHVSCKLCSESSDLKWKVIIQISIWFQWFNYKWKLNYWVCPSIRFLDPPPINFVHDHLFFNYYLFFCYLGLG